MIFKPKEKILSFSIGSKRPFDHVTTADPENDWEILTVDILVNILPFFPPMHGNISGELSTACFYLNKYWPIMHSLFNSSPVTEYLGSFQFSVVNKIVYMPLVFM